MSEISKPINPTAEIKEQKITLSETQKETLTDSLMGKVKTAIKEIQEKVKVIIEKPKLKGLIESKNYSEVFLLIDSYPEDVKKIILKKIYPGIITFSNNNSGESRENDRKNAELFIKNYKYFEESDTEDKGRKKSYNNLLNSYPDILLDNSNLFFKEKTSDGKDVLNMERSIATLEKIIQRNDVKCLVRNLEFIASIQENAKGDFLLNINYFLDKITAIILNTDEKIIQEELSKCSEKTREIYSNKFEKNYFKKEYLEKSVIGAKEKLDKAETLEEKQKYEKVIAGLEYLKNYEENVIAHCEKMFLKYEIFEEDMRNHMLGKIKDFMNNKMGSGGRHESIEKLAKKQNLEYLEYLGFLQQQLNEMMEEMCFYSYKQSNALNSILNPENGVPTRFTSQIEIDEKQIRVVKGRISDANTMKIMERTLFGDSFHARSRKENNCTYGFINHSETAVSKGDVDGYDSSDYGYGKYSLRLSNGVRERTTIFLGDSSMANRAGLATFAELPHISVLLSAYNYIEDTDQVNLGINRDFMQESTLMKGFSYFECQYHGQTGSSDQIEYILYSEKNTTREELEKINSRINNINEEEDEKPDGGNKILLMSFSEYARKKKE